VRDGGAPLRGETCNRLSTPEVHQRVLSNGAHDHLSPEQVKTEHKGGEGKRAAWGNRTCTSGHRKNRQSPKQKYGEIESQYDQVLGREKFRTAGTFPSLHRRKRHRIIGLEVILGVPIKRKILQTNETGHSLTFAGTDRGSLGGGSVKGREEAKRAPMTGFSLSGVDPWDSSSLFSRKYS